MTNFAVEFIPESKTDFITYMDSNFKIVAKTLKGLEAVLADELRAMGALNVEPGRRMVSFEGNLETLYRANLCCRTALRILKPIYTFKASDPDELYDRLKEFDWNSIMSVDSTFAIDTVLNSDSFSHSRYATYRVKDAIVDWYRDRYDDRRPNVRLTDADVLLNVHIHDTTVTVSLDSSGESLHKRGWRVATTEAPINEVLAAGILLMSGYRGQTPFVDPMCGSGTFLVEAALIAANINPGVFRQNYAFQRWRDYNQELFEELWNNDTAERTPGFSINGADILPSAIEVTRRNLRAAGVDKFVKVEVRKFSEWRNAPAPEGILVMNPPYGERISAPDMEGLYALIGQQLKHIFTGWTAWIIGLRESFFQCIGLAPSEKVSLMNGSLDCELREYILFAGNKRDFRAAGGRLKTDKPKDKPTDRKGKPFGAGKPFGHKDKFADKPAFDRKPAFGGKPKGDRKPEFEKPMDQAPEVSENPLAARRNPDALKSILNRTPKLPKDEGPIMRSRGWRKKDE